MPTLYAGTTVRFTLAVTDAAGVAATPGSIALTLVSPTGATATPSITSPSTGNYYADHQCDQGGTWLYRWETTTPNAATEGSVAVTRSAI